MIDPTLLSAASQVVVIRGRSCDDATRAVVKKRKHRSAEDRALLVERDQTAISEIAELLSDTIPGAPPMDWMEWPQVSLVFIAEGRVLREVGLLSKASHVRDVEFHDLPLRNPLAVDAWLRCRGVELPSPPDTDLNED
ncbi:hypothetical protein ACWEOO_38320 [Kribbella sp. NPDC004138]